MFSVKTLLTLGKLIPILDSRNSLQQLKSTGAQARPSNSAPNPDVSQGSAVVPQHVQSVAARIEKTSDISSKITVSFQRLPQDYFFVDARCFVSGYKGNPAPVQVASGQSPLSFSLENTGEAMTVTVQASGSLGQAPLATAPTTTLQVVKTPLATTPTTSGTGTGIFDVAFFYNGSPAASFELLRIPVAHTITFPVGLAGSYASCENTSTGSVTLPIKKIVSGVTSSLGTINFSAGSATATFTFTTATTLSPGHIIIIEAPSSQDATFSIIGGTLAATR
jgi:hypothetical protein